MKVLVTGAAGHIGRYVVRELLDHGHEPQGFDLQPHSDSPVPHHCGDLRDLSKVVQAVAGCEAVCHLGAVPTGRPRPEWPDIWEINVGGTYNVFEACVRERINRAVLASSGCVAGVCNQVYRPKTPYLPIDEAVTPDLDEPYSLSKLVNELTGKLFALHFGMAVIALRLWNVMNVERDGIQILHCPLLWSKLDVRDVAQAFRLALEKAQPGFDIFCIGPRYRYSPEGEIEKPEVTLQLLKESGVSEAHLTWGFPFSSGSTVSSEKAVRLLGYEPRY